MCGPIILGHAYEVELLSERFCAGGEKRSVAKRAHGIININGAEHTFIVEDGNRNGTQLEDWDGDKVFEPSPRIQWALQPISSLIDAAIISKRGPFLVAKWDIVAKRPDVAEIPRNYAYDRMVQPGGLTEKYYKTKADQHKFVLVSQEEADATRARLMLATDTSEQDHEAIERAFVRR